MKTKNLILASALILAFSIAACGQAPSSTTGTNSSTTGNVSGSGNTGNVSGSGGIGVTGAGEGTGETGGVDHI